MRILFNKFSLFLSITILFLASANNASAQGIRVIDCKGNTRAIRQMPENPALSDVQVSVVDSNGLAVKSGKFKLFNAKGKTIFAEAKDGLAIFKEVDPGVWMLGSELPGFFFSEIALSDSPIPGFWDNSSNFLGNVGKIALVTGAIVGAAVIVDQVSDGNGGGGGDSSMVTPPSAGCPACDPDQNAPSLSPF